MKNFFKLLTVSLLAISVSCSSDDDSSSNDSVEGTFRLVAFETETSFDLDGDGDSSTNLIEETGCYENQTLTFNADNNGVFVSTSFLDIYVDIEIVNGEEIVTQIVECVPEDDSSTFTWTQNGNIVSVTVDGDVLDLTFSGDQLSFTLPSGFFAEVIEGNIETAQITEDVTFRYERI